MKETFDIHFTFPAGERDTPTVIPATTISELFSYIDGKYGPYPDYEIYFLLNTNNFTKELYRSEGSFTLKSHDITSETEIMVLNKNKHL